MREFHSWGRTCSLAQAAIRLSRDTNPLIPHTDRKLLAVGKGRSYGDSCLNDDGLLLDCNDLRRFLGFDQRTGVLSCEPGVTLEDILQLTVCSGWFLPVTPGTKYVTVAGAVANDVHGKNHHRSGTFGRHVRALEVVRSNGERIACSPDTNSELFSATIGGIGLTGLIVRVDLQLRPVNGPFIDMESIKFSSLDEFFEISSESDRKFEYTVAWLDCLANNGRFGRGIFMRGNHADKAGSTPQCAVKRPLFSVPFDAPPWLLNPLTIRAFNSLYYAKQRTKTLRRLMHYDPFFYPLDGVLDWNRIYGKRGLFQFQCVVPNTQNNRAIRNVLRMVVDSRKASFLAVIKEFGNSQSLGLLSYPRPGVTLCLDFANQGLETLNLLRELETVTRQYGGALYPAKDACMSADGFKAYYPRWREFSQFIDPGFSSNFWRRVVGSA